MKRKTLIYIIITTVLIAVVILFSVFSKKDTGNSIDVDVQYGQFEITLTVTGELQAINFTEINAPASLRGRELRIQSITIYDLIPEGTIVNPGDWVATLDKSELDNSLKDILDVLESETSSYENSKLDSAITLSQLRDDLANLLSTTEERKIILEQSIYEPPAVIRQAEISLEKSVRAYEQAKNNYNLRVQQEIAAIREAEISMERSRRTKDEMEAVLNEFDVLAPASGMVIYKRESNGQKRTAGSTITPRDLVVATLPDLSRMLSLTYINEVDISLIRVGQEVNVGVDAFPDKHLRGKITYMSNIGEPIPNTDAKVFEVKIELLDVDNELKPSMTTSNNIIIGIIDSVLFIPIEAVHKNDSLSFVYTKEGYKQIIIPGEINDNYIIVEQGLKEGEQLYLSTPTEPELFDFVGLELWDIIKNSKEDTQ